jgi:FlaA1/EpsC-like NDP-sugar epimerase
MTNIKKTNYFVVLFDVITIIISSIIVWNFSHKNLRVDSVPSYLAIPFLVFMYLLLYKLFYLYNLDSKDNGWSEIINICKANLTGSVILVFIICALRDTFSMFFFPRSFIISFFILNTFLEIIQRKSFIKLKVRLG